MRKKSYSRLENQNLSVLCNIDILQQVNSVKDSFVKMNESQAVI